MQSGLKSSSTNEGKSHYRKETTMKRLLSLVLVLCTLFSLIAVPVSASLWLTPDSAYTDVTYRWDFKNLNEANGQNNLSPSMASTNGYSLESGYIVLHDRTTDFELSEVITLTNEYDWSIEWRGALTENSALFGIERSNNNFIYLCYMSPYNQLRMVSESGTTYKINYGEYGGPDGAATELNTWKITYTANTSSLVLWIYDSYRWKIVGETGTFTFNFTRMFGRHGEADVNLRGRIDYIEVVTKQKHEMVTTINDVHYRWDFNDLTEKDGKNNLSDGAVSTANYSITDGVLVTADDKTFFKLERPFFLSNTFDWSIEYRAKFNNASCLFGTEGSDNNFFYNAYTMNWTQWGFRLVGNAGNYNNILYNSYQNYNSEMHTWRADYTAATQTLVLKFLNETTNEWEVVGTKVVSAFDLYITHMFGRHSSGGVCMYGEFDYMEIKAKEKVESFKEEEEKEPFSNPITSSILFTVLMRNKQTETKNATSMYGIRVNKLLNESDSIIFNKHDIKVEIPKETLENLDIANTTKLKVTITNPEENTAKIAVTLNKADVNSLEGTVVTMPWDAANGTDLFCADIDGNIISNAIYNAATKTVTFTISAPGTYTVKVRSTASTIPTFSADGPKLTSLTLDDGTALNFKADVGEYIVTLPAGRPRIPRVTATAENGATVEITQATFADTAEEAMAVATVIKDGQENDYMVRFIKDKESGFELQYQDRYTYVPAYTLAAGESFTFASSNNDLADVDTNGVITAWKTSNEPITITASVNGEVKDTLVIDKINRAQVAVFLIVGQSNAAGSSDSGVDRTNEQKLSLVPEKGIAWCVEVSNGGDIGSRYDLSRGRVGFSTSLSKTWYELSGEKVLCIQSAVGGSPIECWKKDGDRYGSGTNLYNNTLKAYNKYKEQFNADNSNFEIVRTQYYWCQGETAMTNTWNGNGWTWNDNYVMTADDYYTRFMEIHANFVKEMDVELGSIMLVRALEDACSEESADLQLLTDLVPARAAQYALSNSTTDDLFIASRICDIARMQSSSDKTSLGYGYMGPENVHYLQVGYNAQGIELATNAFAKVNAYANRAATELEVIAADGRTRYADNETIEIASGANCQITAIVLPLYADDANITYTVTKGAEFCSIDKYGMIHIATGTAVDSKAVILIKSEGGLMKTLNINVTAHPYTDATYRWDFNDMTEENGANNLTDSEKSTKAYTIQNGVITTTDKTTDFKLATPFSLTNEYDWSIEWKAQLEGASCLFGTESSKNNFLYLAYEVNAWSNPFRLVTDEGIAYMIPYGDYAAKNTEMNTWRAEYTIADSTLTLKFYNESTKTWEVVGSTVISSKFELNFTHMFGRYTPDATVCLNGKVDYVQVVTKQKPAVTISDISYRWDFNDLTEKNGANNLTDSTRSTKQYSLKNGVITTQGHTTDFKLSEKIWLSNTFDWAIEWKAKLNSTSCLLGDASSQNNFLYLAYEVAGWDNPFRMVTDDGTKIMIPYGSYATKNTSMNTWKAEYVASTKTLTLYFYNESTKNWETVGSKIVDQTFNFYFTHLFGRYTPDTDVCMNGQVDYVQVTTKQKSGEEAAISDVHYRWDFNDLTEKDGANNLTDSARSTKSYTIKDGIISTSGQTTDFKMDKSFWISDTFDWSIEYRCLLRNASCLFGDESSQNNFLYLAYDVAPFGYPLRLVTNNGSKIMIPYNDYASNCTEMNTWKIEYSAEERILTFLFYNESRKNWEIVGDIEIYDSFNCYFTHMFGRYTPDTDACMSGDVDYIEIIAKQING